MKPIIGVLALQGCVQPHKPHIEAAGGIFQPVKNATQIMQADALILPGGESTTMIRLLKQFDVWDSLYQAMQQKPTWGICAGAILMAKHVSNPTQDSFGVIDISVTRNGYGRQLDSIVENIDGYPVSYIRAPIFEVENPDLIIKSTRDESPTWIIQGDKMVTSFHPELTPLYPSPMHSYFVQSINQ